MLLFSVLVAGSNSFGKLIAHDISAGALTAARFFVGAAIVLAVLVGTGRFQVAHYHQPLRYLPLIASYSAFFVLMFYALETTSAVSTGALFTLMPLMSAVLAWGVMKKSSAVTVWIALGVGAIGALWIVFGGSLDRALRLQVNQGDVIFFVGVVAYSFYAVLVPRLTKGEPVIAVTFAVMAGGAGVLGILFLSDILATNWAQLPMRVWAVLGYLAIFAGICSMWLLTYASGRLAPTQVMAYTYLTPFWVIVLEPVMGRAMPSLTTVIGVVPILLALGLLIGSDR